MAYQMAATPMTLNDLQGHSQVLGHFKCNPSNICAAFYTILTDSMLARSICVSCASCSITTRSLGAGDTIFGGFCDHNQG